ncbi:uncharacterized protein G2W53_040145 [Senna tora]|uniref:Uncharacterized protein n=1 Tax=Senna tora TaxID=362788 RepID=A0A834SPZ0_9FABA|nr:uncharacterized protein G2W53_040145 [Senna tora]
MESGIGEGGTFRIAKEEQSEGLAKTPIMNEKKADKDGGTINEIAKEVQSNARFGRSGVLGTRAPHLFNSNLRPTAVATRRTMAATQQQLDGLGGWWVHKITVHSITLSLRLSHGVKLLKL